MIAIQEDILRIVTPAGQSSAIDGDARRQSYFPQARWIFYPSDIDVLRESMDERRNKLKSAVVLPASKAASKVMLLAGVTPNLTGKARPAKWPILVA